MENQTLTNSLDSLQVYLDKLRAMDTYEDSRAIRYLEASRSLIQNLTRFLDESNRSVAERMIMNIDLLISGEKNKTFFDYAVYDHLKPLRFICLNGNFKPSHGGVRPGSGRKQLPPTTQIRVDSELADVFKSISSDYRSNPEKAGRIRQALLDI